MTLDDVVDPLNENILHTPFPEDSNASDTNGVENEEISKVSPCDEQAEDGATEEQPLQYFRCHSIPTASFTGAL